jgi:hypothetical protein
MYGGRGLLMTLQEFQSQALQLSIAERWGLVQSLLLSIQQETVIPPNPINSISKVLAGLDPWTQSLVGVIQLGEKDPADSYVDYLEEKYR